MALSEKQALSLNAFQYTAEQAGAEVKEAGQTEEEAFFRVEFPERPAYLMAINPEGGTRLTLEGV